jgi:hypothetical protein
MADMTQFVIASGAAIAATGIGNAKTRLATVTIRA